MHDAAFGWRFALLVKNLVLLSSNSYTFFMKHPQVKAMRFKRFITLFISVFLFSAVTVNITPAIAVNAQEDSSRTVRVGWYESSFCYHDQFGRRSGIAYEYQQEVAAHTGWTYVYEDASWPVLLAELLEGQIDLLSDVSFTAERAEKMLFSSLPMGSEYYYVFIDANNTSIDPNNLETLNGKKIGVNKGSVQLGLFQEWANERGIVADIIELTTNEETSMEMLNTGALDAFVGIDSISSNSKISPICKVGSSDYYFAVNKNRPDILGELNEAMFAIQDEDPRYNERLVNDYLTLAGANAFLSESQETWLKQHETIQVGYLDNYMPFCGTDKSTNQLTGALKNYLAYASTCLKNVTIHFETKPYQTITALLSALNNGAIDCAFPLDLSTDYRDKNGLSATNNAIMQTEMAILMRASDRFDYSADKILRVAVNNTDENMKSFVMDAMPNWKVIPCKDDEECYTTVSSAMADCMLAPSYRLTEIQGELNSHKLTGLPTGETMNFTFAVNRKSHELYSILNKIASLPTKEQMEYVLVSYTAASQESAVMSFIKDNWIPAFLILAVAFTIAIVVLARKLKAERRAVIELREIEEALRVELDRKEHFDALAQTTDHDDSVMENRDVSEEGEGSAGNNDGE